MDRLYRAVSMIREDQSQRPGQGAGLAVVGASAGSGMPSSVDRLESDTEKVSSNRW